MMPETKNEARHQSVWEKVCEQQSRPAISSRACAMSLNLSTINYNTKWCSLIIMVSAALYIYFLFFFFFSFLFAFCSEVDELLRNGADPNLGHPEDHGLTPLHFAARCRAMAYSTSPSAAHYGRSRICITRRYLLYRWRLSEAPSCFNGVS